MLSPSILKKTADQLVKRNLINLTKLSYYCTSSSDKLNFKQESETGYQFEAPNIFQESHEDIVKQRNLIFTIEKLENSDVMNLPTNCDWPSVWPTAKTFDPNTVPLPIHQGAHRTGKQYKNRMNRWQNSELIKIPNFLHLSPEAIKRQTDAIKKYCTPWPDQLTDKKLAKLNPVTIYSTDRIHSSPSIRDARARTVRLEIHIDKLKLDKHSRRKLIKLLGKKRYDFKTNLINIETSDCPFKEQNLELSIYRLTACYFEAWKTEDWEIIKDK